MRKNGVLAHWSRQNKKLSRETLEKVGMADYAHKPIGELSGGRMQRYLSVEALISHLRC
jgi:manganese/iron transport system ATP-binding protein